MYDSIVSNQACPSGLVLMHAVLIITAEWLPAWTWHQISDMTR